MARRIFRESQEQKLMHKWWIRILIALAFLGLSYGFISLALDSGSWLEYGVGLVLLWYAVRHSFRAFRPEH